MEAMILKMLIWWDSLTPGGVGGEGAGEEEQTALDIHSRIGRAFHLLEGPFYFYF